jgi:putative ATP-dependent endonuclease of OLD family
MEAENLKLYIKEIHIENFKCFHGNFDLLLNDGLNIIVGDNEAGKSTILESIYLALTGTLNGRYLKNELTQYLFNNEVVEEYKQNLIKENVSTTLPQVLIEVFIGGGGTPDLEGNGNSKNGNKEQGFRVKIAFDEKYQKEYESLIRGGDIRTLPIEYYDISWESFARNQITPKNIPLKAALIDSSTHRYLSGSDIYIAQIIRDVLETDDVVAISQAHRKLKEGFMDDASIKKINEKIKDLAKISDREVKISVDLSTKNAWENSLMTYLDDVPFQYIGKGEQTIIKTRLALAHKKSAEANLILLEEPENYLSHSRLNKVIKDLGQNISKKQIIVATHSSFVANKLGLGNLILLDNRDTLRFDQLNQDTKDFFSKLSGYDTLRLLLCKKAILVEGDSDELIVQKAYMMKNNGRLPIEDEIDVISVGTAFLRFLEVAKHIKKSVMVVTDNDGDVESVEQKYKEYVGDSAATKEFIKICFDKEEFTGNNIRGEKFNYNTLEPGLLRINGRENLNTVFGTTCGTDEELLLYMKNNKTECALKIFGTEEKVNFPQNILDAIENGNKRK